MKSVFFVAWFCLECKSTILLQLEKTVAELNTIKVDVYRIKYNNNLSLCLEEDSRLSEGH